LVEGGGGGGVLVDRFSGCGESVRADLRWEEGRAATAPLGGSSGRGEQEEVGWWEGATGTGRCRVGAAGCTPLLAAAQPSSGMWWWWEEAVVGAHISKVWDLLLLWWPLPPVRYRPPSRISAAKSSLRSSSRRGRGTDSGRLSVEASRDWWGGGGEERRGGGWL
jgi:hypothetical protein